MKIICTQENLHSGLGIAVKIISANNTLPILNNILLKTENGQLKISSTNLEVAINTKIRCKIEEQGQITVGGKTLNELINTLPNENLELYTDKNNLVIKTESQEFKIKTLPVEEFPLIPETQSNNTTSFEQEKLKQAINQVVFSASQNQTQPEISGIYLSLKGGEARFAATDRYRLAEAIIPAEGLAEVIIPQKTTLEVARILSLRPEKVEVGFSENQIFFTIGQTDVISRLVDGQYPDYKNIIPDNFNSTMVVEKNKLQNALKANALFSQNSSSVRMAFAGGKLTISSESEGLGSGIVDIQAKVEGEEGSLLLNFKYVLDFLAQLQGGSVVIKVVNDTSPAVFVPEGRSDYLYLVMPIKI
ncbi:MAG: DNA polymerase III subunit beta [Patescibacteria group bacterium]